MNTKKKKENLKRKTHKRRREKNRRKVKETMEKHDYIYRNKLV